MTRIGVLIDELMPGGVQKIAIEEVKWLRFLGYDTKLLVLWRQSSRKQLYYPYMKKIDEDMIPVLFLSDFFPRIFKFSIKFPKFHFFSSFHITSCLLATLKLYKLSEKFDVIIFHGTYTCFTAWVIQELLRIPCIPFIHDPVTYVLTEAYSNTVLTKMTPLGTFLDKKIAQKTPLILTQSNFHKNLIWALSQGEKQIEALYPGCYPAEKIPNKREKVVLMHTRWGSTRRSHTIVMLAEKLKDVNIRIVVSGSWTQQRVLAEINNNLKEKALDAKVEIKGNVDEEELRDLFLHSLVWVHPTVEAFGMGALEAASQGCPIIIPKGSGVTELFTHGVHGFFPQEGDMEQIASYIRELIVNDSLAQKMSFEAWKKAKQYSWEAHTKKLLEILSNHGITEK